MIAFIIITVLTALFASFLISFLKVSGIVQYVQIHGNDFFNKLFNCNFCLSFWTCLVLSLLIVLVTVNFWFLTIPFFATTITRNLL